MTLFPNIFLTIIAYPYIFLGKLPFRIWNLLKHLFIIPFSKSERNKYNQPEKPKLIDYLRYFGAWVGVLITKIIDLTGLYEIVDILFHLVKPNSRKLTELEIQEAKKVFGDSLNYWQIRIDEKSVFAKLGAKFNGSHALGVVTFRSVNFTHKINCKEGNFDTAWLIHELVHVKQMQSLGSQYIFEALYAQNTIAGYYYGGFDTLKGNHKLNHFNLEQQADIAKHYYQYALNGNKDKSVYEPYILDIQKGKF